MSPRKREENLVLLMRLLINWLDFWVECKELPLEERLDVDFGIRQINYLQVKLEQFKEQLEKSKN